MEIIIYIAVLVLVLIVIKSMTSLGSSGDGGTFKNAKVPYVYTRKNTLMSSSEIEFYKILEAAAEERYYIFPQVHLSAILEHKIKGQNWSGAFKHINGKSVDYVLCDKETLNPIYAVELDDKTHERTDRHDRDIEVNRIFQEAGIPLIHFSDYRNLSQSDIVRRFADAHREALGYR